MPPYTDEERRAGRNAQGQLIRPTNPALNYVTGASPTLAPYRPPTLNATETRTLNLPTSNVCNIPSTAKAYVVNVTLIPNGGGVNDSDRNT